LRDELGLALVLLGVQHVVLDAFLLQQRRDVLGLSRSRSVPTRIGWPFSWRSRMSVDHGVELLALGLVDDVGVIVPDHVRWVGTTSTSSP
jgi:hypothetical protein